MHSVIGYATPKDKLPERVETAHEERDGKLEAARMRRHGMNAAGRGLKKVGSLVFFNPNSKGGLDAR
ncbi:MAG: hypothetical protein GXP32_04655 [Kiritimatiellaeota bacterium]|nr:hypothetical protein [Kiritimatiellota bacterium]